MELQAVMKNITKSNSGLQTNVNTIKNNIISQNSNIVSKLNSITQSNSGLKSDVNTIKNNMNSQNSNIVSKLNSMDTKLDTIQDAQVPKTTAAPTTTTTVPKTTAAPTTTTTVPAGFESFNGRLIRRTQTSDPKSNYDSA